MLMVLSMTTLHFSFYDDCLQVICDFCASASAGAGIRVMCHWWCYWYHVMLMPMASHDHKSHVAPHFNHLDLRNVMMSLMTQSASLDATVSVNGITWPKRSYCTLFCSFWCKECNTAIDISISVMWWWYWYHVRLMSEPMVSHDPKVMLHLIVKIFTSGMQGCYLWCHRHLMMPTLVLHDSNVNTNGVRWPKKLHLPFWPE